MPLEAKKYAGFLTLTRLLYSWVWILLLLIASYNCCCWLLVILAIKDNKEIKLVKIKKGIILCHLHGYCCYDLIMPPPVGTPFHRLYRYAAPNNMVFEPFRSKNAYGFWTFWVFFASLSEIGYRSVPFLRVCFEIG